MPRTPRVSGRKLARALERQGFRFVRMVGDHATFHNPETSREATVPLTRKTLKIGTIRSVLRQAGLSTEDLRELL